MTTHQDLHFVGSIPLDSGAAVMSTLGARFGGVLRRVPDGETGPRSIWVQTQERAFVGHPAFTPVGGETDWRKTAAKTTQYRLRSGVDLAHVGFAPLGYAAAATASYRDFASLKQQGVLPAPCRFMVAIPSPYNVMSWSVEPASRLAVEPTYQAALLAEVHAICDAIPPAELAIQWDCAHDMQAFEGARVAYFEPAREGIAARLAALGNAVPHGVELGYHLCYGSYGGRHFLEPKSTGAMVELSNMALAKLERRCDWIHMPVPIERDDVDYFAPLADLRLGDDATLYLGLLHERDGVAGARRRIAAAERAIKHFGLAAECGFGRIPADRVPAILETHAAVLAAI